MGEERLYKCNQCSYETDDLSSIIEHERVEHEIGEFTECTQEAKRDPVSVRYDVLVPSFLKAMAQIGGIGALKYKDIDGKPNYQLNRMDRDKSPINHIYAHLIKYQENEKYDHADTVGTDRKYHLIAIAFNAMMEWWYEENIPLGLRKDDRKR